MTSHFLQASGWTCAVCNRMNQHDWNKPLKHETSMGTWMYMPFGTSTPEPVHQSGSQTNTRSRQRRRRRNGGPPSQPSMRDDEEQAESERMTYDPSVQPTEQDDPQDDQHGREEQLPVRALRPAPSRGGAHHHENGDQQVLELLRQLARRDGNSDRSWTSQKGPQPGVKFRGGAPPPAPIWKYQSSDVRAYERFERKVRMWQLQIKQYMTAAEASLMLYTSLQGEAEQQLEFADIEKIYEKNGIDYILEQLKSAFQQKTAYVKRHHLHEYENMGRYPQESIRAYCNRYRRVEAALKALGVDISLTYDDEARGSRLLDRARLSAEQQRMILVGTNGQLTFDLVASALNMQYPDYKPAPMTVSKDGQKWNGKGGNAHHGTTSSTSSSSQQSSSSNGPTRKGDGKFRQARRVFQTVNEEEPAVEEEENEAAEDDPPADGDEAPDDGAEDDEQGDEQDDFTELAQVLTVTAKKLASMTQGRKFKHAPKKSIEQRKKETTCAACGVKGHWAGDAECEASNGSSFSKDQSKGNGKSHKGSNKTSANAETSKKVFTVRHYTGFEQEEEDRDNNEESTHLCRVVFQADAIPHLTFNNTNESIGYMTIDTACQRSCCGARWHDAHVHTLQDDWFLSPTYRKQNEKFQFGAGEPQMSSTLALLPCGLSEKCCYLGASILEANIPFLCSLRTLERLGMTLDLCKRVAHFSTLQCDVHLVYVHGHLAVPIMDLSQDAPRLLQEIKNAGLTDAEVNVATTAFTFKADARDLNFPDGTGLSPRADGMACAGKADHQAGTWSLDPSAGCEEHEHHPGGDLPESHCGRDQVQAATKGHSKGQVQVRRTSNNKADEQSEQHITNGNHVPSSKLSEVRERLGTIRPMRDVHGKMEVGRWRMEIGWFFLNIAATAAIALDANHWGTTAPASVPHSTGSICNYGNGFYGKSGPSSSTMDESGTHASINKGQIQSTIDDILVDETYPEEERGRVATSTRMPRSQPASPIRRPLTTRSTCLRSLQGLPSRLKEQHVLDSLLCSPLTRMMDMTSTTRPPVD